MSFFHFEEPVVIPPEMSWKPGALPPTVLDLEQFPDLLDSLMKREAALIDAQIENTEREAVIERKERSLAQWQRTLICVSVALVISVLMVMQAAQNLGK